MLGQQYYTPEAGWIRKDIINNQDEFTIVGGAISNPGFNGVNQSHPYAYRFNELKLTIPSRTIAIRIIGLTFTQVAFATVYLGNKEIGWLGEGRLYYMSGFEQEVSVDAPTVLSIKVGKINGSDWVPQVHAIDYLTDSGERYILHDSNGYSTIGESGLQTLPDFTATPESMQANGFTDAQILAGVAKQLAGSFDLLRYHPDTVNTAIAIKHLLAPQLIAMTEDIDISAYATIHNLTLATVGAAGTIKLALSFDGGLMWRIYKNGWQPIACTPEALSASGMTAEALSSIPSEQWTAAVTGPMRVAYYLAKSAITDDLAVASLTITGDTVSWELANHDDYQCSYPTTTTMQIKLLSDGSYKINYVKQK